jgi:hypothetical protein
MFSFFKKKKTEPTTSIVPIVPEWASFFTVEEYKAFMKNVDAYFKQLNINYEVGDGEILVDPNEFGYERMGLMNVAQVCKQHEISEYSTHIAGHFNSLSRAYNFNKEFDSIAGDFDKVKQFIGVRLYEAGYPNYIGKENALGKDFAGNIFAMIVFDFPDSVTNIKPANYRME